MVQKLLFPLSEAGSLEAVSLVLRSSRRASSSEKPRGVSPGGEATGDNNLHYFTIISNNFAILVQFVSMYKASF